MYLAGLTIVFWWGVGGNQIKSVLITARIEIMFTLKSQKKNSHSRLPWVKEGPTLRILSCYLVFLISLIYLIGENKWNYRFEVERF